MTTSHKQHRQIWNKPEILELLRRRQAAIFKRTAKPEPRHHDEMDRHHSDSNDLNVKPEKVLR